MIMKQVVIHAWNTHTCTCTRKPGELPVRGDLAYTPAQMYEAAKAGVPISSQSNSLILLFDFFFFAIVLFPPYFLFYLIFA